MRKTRFDLDTTALIRRWPESQPGTLACYLALREIASLSESTTFHSTLGQIARTALLSETGARRALDLMAARNVIHKTRTGCGLKVKILKVARI